MELSGFEPLTSWVRSIFGRFAGVLVRSRIVPMQLCKPKERHRVHRRSRVLALLPCHQRVTTRLGPEAAAREQSPLGDCGHSTAEMASICCDQRSQVRWWPLSCTQAALNRRPLVRGRDHPVLLVSRVALFTAVGVAWMFWWVWTDTAARDSPMRWCSAGCSCCLRSRSRRLPASRADRRRFASRSSRREVPPYRALQTSSRTGCGSTGLSTASSWSPGAGGRPAHIGRRRTVHR